MKTVQEVLPLLSGVKQHGDYWTANCPAHEDEKPSLSLSVGKDGRPLFKCHAGCEFTAIAAALHLRPRDLLPDREQSTNGKAPLNIVATYDYTDADGNLLFQVVRLMDHKFVQRRPNGEGGWIWDRKGVPLVLYRLPQVRAAVAAKRLIFIVEGEKDVHSLEAWKVTATTNAGGAEKWGPSYVRPLIDAKTVIVPDNDEAGRRHAEIVARSLSGKAASISIVELPGLPEKGDVSDWIAAGGTYDEFTRLVREAPAWTPPVRDTLPEVIVNNRPLRDLTGEAIRALDLGNVPPQLFVRAGALVRWRQDEKGRPMIETLSGHHVRGLLTRSADFLRMDKEGPKHISPPDHVVADILVFGRWTFPNLKGITETPVLRSDGSILEAPGYDSATQLVYAPASGLHMQGTSTNPTAEEVRTAVALVEEAIGEFPYQDQSSRANALALLLTPVLRPAITGPVPLALIDAPQQGTGKSLLAETITLIATGRPAAMMQAPKEEEEWRKSLTASFKNGDTMMIYDNIESRISAPSLATAITAPVWKDRVLGGSEVFEFPIECTWMATGNNLQPDGDMPRRGYWIRLDAQMARPWQRTGFKHPDLRGWVMKNRGRLVSALLTICRAWFAARCPKAQVPLMGSFEGWTRVVGGVMAYAGVDGFLGNLDQMYEQIDTTQAQWEGFALVWRETYDTIPQRIVQVVSDLRSTLSREMGSTIDPRFIALRDAMPDDLLGDVDGSEDRLKRRLGIAIGKRIGVRHGPENLRFERGSRDEHAHAERWRVVRDGDLLDLSEGELQ